MTVRPLQDSDIPILQELAAKSGYPYPDLNHPHIEAVLVVVDSEDNPLMACAAKRLVELYLYVDPSCSAVVKMGALSLLHQGMAWELRKAGYSEANCFLPSQIADRFGRRLARSFGWARNWVSFYIHF